MVRRRINFKGARAGGNMKIIMNATVVIGNYGERQAGTQHSDLPDDVCRQLIEQGTASEVKATKGSKTPIISEE